MVVYYSYARPADEGIQSGCFWSSEDVPLGVRWRAEVSTKPTRKRFGKYNPQIKPYSKPVAMALHAKVKRRPEIVEDVPLLVHASDVFFRMLGYSAGWAHAKLLPSRWAEMLSGLCTPGHYYEIPLGEQFHLHVCDPWFSLVPCLGGTTGGWLLGVDRPERQPGLPGPESVDMMKRNKHLGGTGKPFWARWARSMLDVLGGLTAVTVEVPKVERTQVEKSVGVNRLKIVRRKVNPKLFQNFKSQRDQRDLALLVVERSFFGSPWYDDTMRSHMYMFDYGSPFDPGTTSFFRRRAAERAERRGSPIPVGF